MLAAFRRAYKERKEARASAARTDAQPGKAAEQVAAPRAEESPASVAAAPASQAPQKRR